MTAVFDLTHPVDERMTLFPGTPPVRLRQIASVDADGFCEHQVTLTTHTGTHVDAAAHVFAEGRKIGEYPAGQFTGKALVLDARAFAGQGQIPLSILDGAGDLSGVDFVFFCTGNSCHWNDPVRYGEASALSLGLARHLGALSIKGTGFDCFGPDSVDSSDLPAHRALLAGGRQVIYENLTGLEELAGSVVFFAGLPLSLSAADGAPVRALAWKQD